MANMEFHNSSWRFGRRSFPFLFMGDGCRCTMLIFQGGVDPPKKQSTCGCHPPWRPKFWMSFVRPKWPMFWFPMKRDHYFFSKGDRVSTSHFFFEARHVMCVFGGGGTKKGAVLILSRKLWHYFVFFKKKGALFYSGLNIRWQKVEQIGHGTPSNHW